MTRRLAAALAAAALLLSGCGGGEPSARPEPSPSTAPNKTPSKPPSSTPTTTPSRTPDLPVSGKCRGVSLDQVKGPRPDYGPQRLRQWSADGAVCAAYWIGRTRDDFVPQSLAVDGAVAYVGGYLHRPEYTDQACQIVVIDLRTGEETRFQAKFEAPVYRPEPTFCRHGGGMQLTADGLWIQETERLWLLDPDKVGRGDPVKRVWRLRPGMRGSAMVVSGRRLGVASFNPREAGRLTWFRVADLLRPGVTELVTSTPDATQAAAVASRRTVPLLQGIAPGRGGLWFSVSGGGCAALVDPDGARHGWVPGAEGAQFVGRDVWALSESGAKHIVRGQRTTVPAIVRLRTAKVLGIRPAC